LNLCGQLSPRETAAVMEGAAVFMGPDSGPMHLAASVRIPCAIAFSARGKPGVWFPAGNENQVVYHKVDCFGCNLETCTVEAKKCLTSISVDEMYEAVMRASKLALQVSQLKG
jgi:heptosyltransferase III